ncbi:MAG: exosortase/archaeosortase family protein [Phycisphaerales bacterium]
MIFWPGMAPFLLGIVCYFVAVVQIHNHMIEGFSAILCLFGLVLLMLGPRMMRWLFLPIVYLAFAVTVSEAIMIAVTFKLQMLASQGSYLMLSLIGSPTGWFTVDIDGNTLAILTNDGRTLPLNVAEACSGMRMVVAFYALAVSVALLACKNWWQRILLFLLAGPVAIFMNMVRVAVLGLASIFDQNLAAGDAHTLIGTILLLPSLLLFLGIVWALNRVVGEHSGGGAA